MLLPRLPPPSEQLPPVACSMVAMLGGPLLIATAAAEPTAMLLEVEAVGAAHWPTPSMLETADADADAGPDAAKDGARATHVSRPPPEQQAVAAVAAAGAARSLLWPPPGLEEVRSGGVEGACASSSPSSSSPARRGAV
jgi:hypothetical protein